METIKTIGEALKAARIANGDTQYRLAEQFIYLLNRAFGQTQILRIEHNKCLPSPDAYKAYKKLYNVKVTVEYTDKKGSIHKLLVDNTA
jgi:hypothetical protein